MNSSFLIILSLVATALFACGSASAIELEICDPNYPLPEGASEKQISEAYNKLETLATNSAELKSLVGESIRLFNEEIGNASDAYERSRVLDRHLIRVCTINGMSN